MSNKQNNVQNTQENNSQYTAGKEKMFSVLQILNGMTERERYFYLVNEQSYSGYSMNDCLEKYSMKEIENAVNQYLTDTLLLGDIFIRKEDKLEYLVVSYDCKEVGRKTYRCLSLKEDKSFILTDIDEITRTKKHIDMTMLKRYT